MGEPGASGSEFRFCDSRTPGTERGKPERGEGGQAGRASQSGVAGMGLRAPESHRCRKAKQTAFHTAGSEPSALRPGTLRRDPRASGSYLHPLSLQRATDAPSWDRFCFGLLGVERRLRRRTNRSQIAPAGTWRA